MFLLWYNIVTGKKVDRRKQLRELQNKLLGIELDLDLIEQDIEAIDCDINYLYLIEEETNYNIGILKKVGIVAELRAYKQSCQKIIQIKAKAYELRSKRNMLDSKLKQKILAKEYYDLEWENLHRIMEDDRVILVFKKRKDET